VIIHCHFSDGKQKMRCALMAMFKVWIPLDAHSPEWQVGTDFALFISAGESLSLNLFGGKPL
jgi:hypothetical protein